MKTIQVFIFLYLAALIASEPCYDFVQKMHDRKLKNDTENLTQQETYFTDYSGTTDWVPSFGNKSLCDEAPGMKYLLAIQSYRRVDYGVWVSEGYAACLPDYCATVPGIFTNETFIITLYEARGWPLMTEPVFRKAYKMKDPSNWEKPPLYYPSIALFAAFTLVAIISSIYVYRQKQANDPTNRQANGEKSRLQAIMESFDLKKNGLQLYQTAKEQGGNEDLATFQYWRTISAYWVIHFHTFLYNYFFVYKVFDDPNYWAIIDTPLWWIRSPDAVDNFFFIGGFFLVYTMTPKLASAPFGLKAFLEQVKNRIMRIWPVYMILLLLYSQVGPYFWSGPGMYIYQNEATPCYNGLEILVKMFFLDGILARFIIPTTGGMCWGSTWYITIEFHIYWFAILIAAVYAKYRRTGRVLMTALIFQGIMFAHARYVIYNNFQGEFEAIFEAKHFRSPCAIWYIFFWGGLWGALYYEYSKLKQKNIFTIFEKYPLVNYICWVAAVLINVELRGNFIVHWDRLSMSYFVIEGIVYGFTIALVYMPLIANGTHPFIKKIMNLRFFQIAGKTSFVVYLVHDAVFRPVLMNTATLRRFSYLEYTWLSLVAIFFAQILAFWVHLCIEKPIVNIETHFTRKKKPVQVRPAPVVEVQFVPLIQTD